MAASYIGQENCRKVAYSVPKCFPFVQIFVASALTPLVPCQILLYQNTIL